MSSAVSRQRRHEPEVIETGLTGYVKLYDRKRGFGFIRVLADGHPKNGEEIFVHASGLAQKTEAELQADDAVQFDVAQGPKGPICVNVFLRTGN